MSELRDGQKMEKKMTRFRHLVTQVFVAFLLASIVGCASVVSRGNFQARLPATGEASVYMVRPYDFQATMLPVSVRVDGQSVGSLALNEGVYLKLKPGEHSIAVDAPIGQLPWSFPVGDHPIVVESGKQYVLSLTTAVVGSTPERGTVSAIYVGGRIGVMPIFGKEGGTQKGARWYLSELDLSQASSEFQKIGFRERP